ncbi:putative disease resistance protein At1g50180 [Zea mays]|uniref:Disease resistance protein RPM1 n=1 Tax=Zea mays TaxID=4577 RepID=A0A1D6QGU4_MAIZE|nr:putative disease resistance protein At1g50180 [Zea mays]AQK57109.1 Disease resistance protein RPM1 [Zea mays]|eukprot:XP_008679363.2 putative disease resistance protein At1g50180 [Zea mays]
MAETAIAAVLSKFGGLAASEAKVLLEVGDDMMLLRDRLEWLQAFLRDADHKRRTGDDRLTRVWVRQMRDVAFEAEDAVDEFFRKVDMEGMGYQRWITWLKKCLLGCWAEIILRHELSGRLEKINSRLHQISENQKEYKVEPTPSATVLTSSTTATSAWRDGYKNAVGFEKEVETLKEMLLGKGRPQLTFISILGESGVGKQTLSRILLHDMEKNKQFDVRVWYNMPSGSTTENLLKQIYKKAGGGGQRRHQPCECECDDDDIEDVLRRHLLANKKYLLILVGISSKTMLNCVRASLPDDNNGSRVVLVLDIENEEVAWHANAMNKTTGISHGLIHHLNRLDQDKSVELFCMRALRTNLSDETTVNSMMSKYREVVYNITSGYPLAIVVLAGLLRFKEKPGQWNAVLQQLRTTSSGPAAADQEAHQQDDQGGHTEEKTMSAPTSTTQAANNQLSTRTSIERVFWASFEDLPNALKSCFLYLAAFPKGTFLSTGSIVRLWMAEGFIRPQKGKTIEELGHDYFKELALRCLVQVSGMNEVGGITNVIVHGRLHGFLHSEAREAGFIDVHDMNDVFVPPSVRRLSFMSFQDGYTTFTNRFCKLRSFICWANEKDSDNSIGSRGRVNNEEERWHDLNFLHGSDLLRVLYISGLRIKELPNEIGNKIHLRYLRVNTEHLKELPASIARLPNLQTLDIRDTEVEEIHPSFWEIKTLRHVIAKKLTLPPSIKEEMGELQTLRGVKPSEEEWDQDNCPLLKMSKLRSLELHGLIGARHGAALITALGQMHLLGHLKLKGDKISCCVFTGERLRYLQTVELDGTVQWPPVAEFNDLRFVRPNLVQLSLTNTNDAPEGIQQELRNAGFVRSYQQLQPVYRLSYRQGGALATKPEQQGEAGSNKMEQQHQGEEAEE